MPATKVKVLVLRTGQPLLRTLKVKKYIYAAINTARSHVNCSLVNSETVYDSIRDEKNFR